MGIRAKLLCIERLTRFTSVLAILLWAASVPRPAVAQDCAPDTLLATLNNPAAALGDSFGWSVAVDGNLAVVGAYSDDAGASHAGTAYVVNAATGAPFTTLSNPAPAVSDFFGWSVAISGNLAVVGAYQDDALTTNSGTAYVFNGTTGALAATLSNPTPAMGDSFGWSVAISGNLAVVGAFQDDLLTSNSGAVYVFNATTGALATTIANPIATAFDQFGASVAISGNLVVAGANGDDAGATDAGEAYVLNATTGALVAILVNPAPAVNDQFGNSVAISGNLAVVGARGDDAGATDAGTAYVFNATTGALVATLSNPTPAVGDNFGYSVAIFGNQAVVGAYADDTGASNAGTAYVFNATTGTLLATRTNPAPGADDRFGNSVAISGNLAVIGAYGDNVGAVDAGTAYTFSCTTPTPTSTPSPTSSASHTPSASPTAAPTETPSPSPTETASPQPSETPTVSPTESPSPTESASPTVSPSPTASPTPFNNASFISSSIPPTMAPNQQLIVTITMRNTGNTTWTQADGYELFEIADACSMLPGSAITLVPSDAILPSTNFDFLATITAPASPMVCNVQFQMRQNGVPFGVIGNRNVTAQNPPNAGRDWTQYE